ncbi:MAG: substrate-binding domain-containing protein [Synergistaceae bacterium]|jgi:inositol transport system substrate-binding protein|nr:substrate-binding domain-containing protein [Synergistaceae bacterium]
MKKKSILVLVLALSLCTALAAYGAAVPSGSAVDYSKLTIAWSPANLTNELQVILTDNLTAAIEGLGCTMLTADPSSDPSLQVSQVENYIAQKVDLILMSPVDAAASGIVVTEAKEAGIPMIIVNCKLDNLDEALSYVGCDDTTAGEMLMRYVVDKLGGKGNIAILRGPDGLDAQIKRTAGFNTVLSKNPGVTVFDSQAANWKTAVAMSTTENWLQTTTLDAVVCENDEMAIGAVEAVKGEGLSCNDVMVVGIDGIDSAIASITAGEMRATLLQDAVAIANKTAEVMQLFLEKGASTIEAEYIIPWTLIDSSNVAKFQK